MSGKVNAHLDGNRQFKICNIGIWVPSTTNVPFDIVSINFEDGILHETRKSKIEDDMAFNEKIRELYTC